MTDAIDQDLTELISKLSRLQEQVGGNTKKGSSASAAVGDDGRIDRFLELRNSMVEKAAALKETMSKVRRGRWGERGKRGGREGENDDVC